ncbi:EMB2654 [Symbiodinium sp. CCMP2456]|nr:EMB2654 [Symbiodinium sp. CCMP2456]
MVAAAPCSLCNSKDIDPEQLARLAQEPRLTTKTITDLGRAQQTSLVLRLLAQLQHVRGEVNIFHYNAALNALATRNSWPRALSTLFLLCRRQLADKTSFSATITACSSERWPMAFSLISRHSLVCLECDIVAVGAAAACGVPWPRAWWLLASLQVKQVQANVVACSALMASCEQSGAWARAIHGFRDMQLIGVQPNVVTYSTTTSSYNTAFLWRAAAQMVGTCLSAREVRVGAGGSRTVVCNSALGALSKSRQWLEVFNVLHDMRLCTLQTSRVSFSLAVDCCQAKQWRKGVGILEHMRLNDIPLNEVSACVAIQSLASASLQGSTWRSVLVFLRRLESASVELDHFSLNAVLGVCEPSGAWTLTLSLFASFFSQRFQPDDVSYMSMLCSLSDKPSLSRRWLHAANLLGRHVAL